MKIIISGVETINKGAELMLYAILQEIERKYPGAKVYISVSQVRQGLDYIKTNLDFRYIPFSIFARKTHLFGLLKRFHIPLNFFKSIVMCDADWFIDGSGFTFTDQWNWKEDFVYIWENKLKRLNSHGCKIVFLPQAFGPADLPNTKKALVSLNKYATIIMPRDKISYSYLEKTAVVDMTKVKLYGDFTSLVVGVFPSQYERIRNGICVIPNMRMIDRGTITLDNYIHLLSNIINEGRKNGHIVYLLNHEGKGDEDLALKIQENIDTEIDVITGLNALEIKGLIASSYLVISSRYHGVASALNSCVPCLATSWSHKYKELFNDYKMEDCLLPLDNEKQALSMIRDCLSKEVNNRIRNKLSIQVPIIMKRTKEMWDVVWRCQDYKRK